MTRRVVVTGMGALTPVGLDVASTWDGIVHGRSGIAPVERFETSDLDVRIAGEVKGFDPTRYLDRKEARRMDRFLQLGLVAAQEAVRDADLRVTAESTGTSDQSDPLAARNACRVRPPAYRSRPGTHG